LSSPETREALECVAESAFSREELETYDRYWDSIRCEVTLLDGSYQEGKLEGRMEGKLEGKVEGKLEVAAALKKAGILRDDQIAVATGLSVEQVQAL
jgi:predicted transposase/invertase (TIGR01784 family)